MNKYLLNDSNKNYIDTFIYKIPEDLVDKVTIEKFKPDKISLTGF